MDVNEIVTLEDGSDGFPKVIADLIKGNIERSPKRINIIRKMKGIARIEVNDGDDSVFAILKFDGEKVQVTTQEIEKPNIVIQGGYDSIVTLTLVPMLWVLPMPWSLGTWAVVSAILRGKIKIKGVVCSPIFSMYLLCLMSVSL